MNLNENIALREEFLTFRLGREEYAIDILQVREIRVQEHVTRIADAAPFMAGVINLRGAIVPIVDLRLKFGLPCESDAEAVVIILALDGRLTGIAVDAVGDVVALLPEQVRSGPTLADAMESGFIRGIAPVDGRMLIVAHLVPLLAAPGEPAHGIGGLMTRISCELALGMALALEASESDMERIGALLEDRADPAESLQLAFEILARARRRIATVREALGEVAEPIFS